MSLNRDSSRRPRTRWQIATLFGIRVYLHPSFFLLLAWVATDAAMRGQRGWSIVASVLLILCVFAIVVLHELGHALTAKRFGIATRDITLLPIGGVARLERMPDRPRHELLIALAGPLVNVVLAAAFYVLVRALGLAPTATVLTDPSGSLLTKLMWINVSLAGFNLLPAFPMDGGRVLRALLAMRFGRVRATDVAAFVGKLVAVLIAFLGLFGNPFLFVMAIFVWIGAQSELWTEHMKSAIAGTTVSRAMARDIVVLDADDTLAHASEISRGVFQRDFPVSERGRLAGVLTHDALVKGLAGGGRSRPVSALMRRQFATARPDDPLETALMHLQSDPDGVVVVVDRGRVTGMLTLEQLGQMLAVDGAAEGHSSLPQTVAP